MNHPKPSHKPYPPGPYPNLLVIGAMKCGTTSLCEELARHPDVFFPETKEPNSLTRHLLGEPHALRDYAALYAGRSEPVLGDGSTGNSKMPFRPDASGLAAELLCAETKLLYVTRDPITRIERHLAHDMGNGLLGEATDLDHILITQPEYLAISAYEMQLSYWRQHFPKQAILHVTLEQYAADRSAMLAAVFAHIGRDPGKILATDGVNANRGDTRRSAHKSALRLVLHSRLYARMRAHLPRSLRRQLAERLLPAATKSDIRLSDPQRAAATRTIAALNDLSAPDEKTIRVTIRATMTAERQVA